MPSRGLGSFCWSSTVTTPWIVPLGDCGSSARVDRVCAAPATTLRARVSKTLNTRLGACRALSSSKRHIQPTPFQRPLSERKPGVRFGTKYNSPGIALSSHRVPPFVKRLMLGERRAAQKKSTSSQFELRSEEHTSELQSQSNLVCRLLLEKKK